MSSLYRCMVVCCMLPTLGTALVQYIRRMVDRMRRGTSRTGTGRAGFSDQGSEVGDHAKGSAANTKTTSHQIASL